MTARFASKSLGPTLIILRPCLDIDTLLSKTLPSRTNYISIDHLELFFCHFEKLNPSVTLQGKRTCLFFKSNSAQMTSRCVLRTLIFKSIERLRSVFAHACYTWTHCVWTNHVPSRFGNAVCKIEIVTYRKCSQLLQTCLRRGKGSCRAGESRDGFGLTVSLYMNWLPCSSNFLIKKAQEMLYPNRNK